MRRISWKTLSALLFIGLLWAIVVALDLHKEFTLASVKAHQYKLLIYYASHSVETTLAYIAIYIVLTAVSFPGAAIISLFAGVLFGPILGTIIVLFSATLGSVGAFWFSRYALSEYRVKDLGEWTNKFSRGLSSAGPYYLFMLRLSPIVPFFLINLVMGLTEMRTWTFAWISFIGMIPGTFLYVNAGTQVGDIETLSDLMSWNVVLALTALGIFPVIVRRLVRH